MAGRARIDAQELISAMTRMYVKVQVRHFLVCARAGGMPDTQAVRGETTIHRASDSGDHSHRRHGGGIIRGANVGDVSSRNDQDMPRMKLSQIEKRDGERVRRDDGCGQLARQNVTEDARCAHADPLKTSPRIRVPLSRR